MIPINNNNGGGNNVHNNSGGLGEVMGRKMVVIKILIKFKK